MSRALQRTIRRVGALLVLQLATLSSQLLDLQRVSGDVAAETVAPFVMVPLGGGALVYLAGSGLAGLVRSSQAEKQGTTDESTDGRV